MKTKNLQRLIFEHGGTILAVAASIGVGVTAYLAAKAQHETDEVIAEKKETRAYYKETTDIYQPPITKKEIMRDCWKFYIPAVVVGGVTIGGIIGSNKLNQKNYKQLAAMYAACAGTYKMYRDEIRREYGVEKDIQIENDIANESDCPDEYGGEVLLWWDPFAERFFRRTVRQVQEAEDILNRNMAITGEAAVSDFNEVLHLEQNKEAFQLGWTCDYIADMLGEFWIDFDHPKRTTDDGLEYYTIVPIVEPIPFDI